MAFSRRENERERRARARVDKEGRVNWLAVGPHKQVNQLVKIDRRAEAEAADKNMRRIAERDAKIAEKYGGPEAWREIYDGSPDEHQRLFKIMKANPELPAAPAKIAIAAALGLEREAEGKRQAMKDNDTDELIDAANRRRQKRLAGKQPDRSHPIVKQEIIPELRLERELNPKSRRPAGEGWRIKLTASPHWQDAIKWFKMTPAERAAAEAKIADEVNTEIGPVAQALSNQAGWDELAASGKLEQMDFFGYVWPTDKE